MGGSRLVEPNGMLSLGSFNLHLSLWTNTSLLSQRQDPKSIGVHHVYGIAYFTGFSNWLLLSRPVTHRADCLFLQQFKDPATASLLYSGLGAPVQYQLFMFQQSGELL